MMQRLRAASLVPMVLIQVRRAVRKIRAFYVAISTRATQLWNYVVLQALTDRLFKMLAALDRDIKVTVHVAPWRAGQGPVSTPAG